MQVTCERCHENFEPNPLTTLTTLVLGSDLRCSLHFLRLAPHVIQVPVIFGSVKFLTMKYTYLITNQHSGGRARLTFFHQSFGRQKYGTVPADDSNLPVWAVEHSKRNFAKCPTTVTLIWTSVVALIGLTSKTSAWVVGWVKFNVPQTHYRSYQGQVFTGQIT